MKLFDKAKAAAETAIEVPRNLVMSVLALTIAVMFLAVSLLMTAGR